MTDLFERQLAERLHAHPLPDEIPDLGIQSVRLAERIRRRRIGAVVVVLAVLLMIPVAGLWRVAAGTGDPPVISGFYRPDHRDPRPFVSPGGRCSGSQHCTRKVGLAPIGGDRETAGWAVRFDRGIWLRARLADSYRKRIPAQCVS